MLRTIPVQRDAAFLSTQMISSFEGKIAYNEQGVSLYDIIHAITQDKDFVSDKVDDFLLTIGQICKEYLTEISTESIILDMPSEFTNGLFASLSKAVYECLCSYLCFRWMEHTKQTEQAKSYGEQYNMLIMSIKELLYVRRMPTVPQKPPTP